MFDNGFNIKESMRSQDWRLINLLFWTKFFVLKKNN